VERFNGRVQREVLGITTYGHRVFRMGEALDWVLLRTEY
jgi:hypothetical protein